MKHLALLLAAAIPTLAWSQVGIGTSTPAATAALELSATDKGFLPPRMTAAQRTAIAIPATGLMVYKTDGTTGLYVYSGSKWLHQASWYSIGTSWFMPSIPASPTTGGLLNLGIGSSALNAINDGDQNVAIGANSLILNTRSHYNTAIGVGALNQTNATSGWATNGGYNVAVGRNAGTSNTTGNKNTFLGTMSDATSGALENSTAIGYHSDVTESNMIQLGNSDITKVNTSGTITTTGSVGIGTTSPNTNAALEIVSTSKGLLLPRLTTTERDVNISGAPAGLMIFNTTDGKVQAYTGSAWVDLH